MKKNLVLAVMLLVSSSAFAQSEPFIGIGLGNGQATMKTKVSGTISGTSINTTLSESDSEATISVLGGTVIDNTHKLSIGYTKYNTEAGSSMKSIDLGYSYYIDQSSLQRQNHNWKPFVSLGYMMNSYSIDIEDTSYTLDIDTKALMLGFGTDYKIDEKSFLTIGYDFSLSTSGSESIAIADGADNIKIDLEFDKMSRLYFGYNFKF